MEDLEKEFQIAVDSYKEKIATEVTKIREAWANIKVLSEKSGIPVQCYIDYTETYIPVSFNETCDKLSELSIRGDLNKLYTLSKIAKLNFPDLYSKLLDIEREKNPVQWNSSSGNC